MVNLDDLEDPPLSLCKEEFNHKVKGKGLICRLCERPAKWNGRTLNQKMVENLIWMAAQPMDENGYLFVVGNAGVAVLRTSQYGQLKHWGLVTQAPKIKGSKTKTSGLWRVTQKGHDFARNRITVHKKVWVYNDTLMGVSDAVTSIQDCFGEFFDYQTMMREQFSLEHNTVVSNPLVSLTGLAGKQRNKDEFDDTPEPEFT